MAYTATAAQTSWSTPVVARVSTASLREIQEEVQRLVTKQLHGFQHIETTDEALWRNMANMNRSHLIDMIKQMEPSWIH